MTPDRPVLDQERCYQIIAARDRRFDGRFFTAVISTGIYCRPICPARTPRRANVRFYTCAAAAEQAGFRPCRRCRPDAAPGTPAWDGSSATVARALRLIGGGALDEGSIDELAARLGMTGRHLRRLFGEHLGVGPLAVAVTRRVHFARRLLDETALPMAEVALGAGFGSVRQFNDAIRKTFGRTPSELRTGRAAVGGAGLALRLPLRRPFDWQGLIGFLAPRAIPGIDVVDGVRYRRATRIDERTCLVEVAPADCGDHLVLTADVAEGRGLLGVVARARRLFDLDADPAPIATHLASDALLARRVRKHPGLRVPGAWDPFELAVRAVLGQQVTVRGATTLAGRLVVRFGEPLTPVGGRRARGTGASDDGDSQLTHVFPTAEALAGAHLPAIAAIGLPRARAETIRALARAVHDEPALLEVAVDLRHAVERLTAIPGIGKWTAHYIAMRALREPDAFPASDLGLRRAIATAERRDRALTPAALEQIAAAWSPWRAYAAMHLWHQPRGR
jgi:AraC family transcriptional regulator of adaptative response / DNA-3-methyladenine glycosylase II